MVVTFPHRRADDGPLDDWADMGWKHCGAHSANVTVGVEGADVLRAIPFSGLWKVLAP